MMPRQPIPILIPPLRPLQLRNISVLASVEPDARLLVVEPVEVRTHCLGETIHITFRVDLGPGLDAVGALAGFQEQHECIEALGGAGYTSVQDCVRGGMVEEIRHLVRIGLTS